MKLTSRRNFISFAALSCTSLTLFAFDQKKNNKSKILHHVFFWLKNPDSKEDLNKLLEGARKLKKINTVKKIHIGIPAETPPRAIIDSSYNVSLLLIFDDISGQNIYQDHPLHQEFIKECSQLWERIIVYDSIDV